MEQESCLLDPVRRSEPGAAGQHTRGGAGSAPCLPHQGLRRNQHSRQPVRQQGGGHTGPYRFTPVRRLDGRFFMMNGGNLEF